MTIEKGSEWGAVTPHREGGVEPTKDLALDLGISSPLPPTNSWRRLPLDLVEVSVTARNGEAAIVTSEQWIVVGRRWHGELLIVSSTAHFHGLRLFARAHPNDGRFDWLTIPSRMPLRQRWLFWRRARIENHLPHPLVRSGTAQSLSHTFDKPTTLRTSDGTKIPGVLRVEVHIVADSTWTFIPAQ